MKKKYAYGIILLIVCGLVVWKLSSSFAYTDPDLGYTGSAIISGTDWGVNITEIDEPEVEGNAVIKGSIDKEGSTFSDFNCVLYNPGDKVSFNITVTNTSKLEAELYSIKKMGLSPEQAELITYSITPIDVNLMLHTDSQDGSKIKTNESQNFRVEVVYNDNIANGVYQEFNLNLGGTFIYKQK